MHVSRFFFAHPAQYPTIDAALPQPSGGRGVLVVAIGWLYVALMMAVAEADHVNGSVLGAIVTFFLYGVGPVALVMYLMATPTRRAIRKAREQAELEAARPASVQPDGSSQPATGAVPPVREEP